MKSFLRESQLAFVKKQLAEHGEISRNYCIENHITRLSAIIHHLRHKEHYNLIGKWRGNDYIYEKTGEIKEEVKPQKVKPKTTIVPTFDENGFVVSVREEVV